MKRFSIGIAACAVLFCGTLMAQQSSTVVSEPLAPMQFLIGGTWTANVQLPSGVVPIRRHLEPILQGRAIHFRTALSGVDKYEGNYAYNAAKKKIEFWYPSSAGDVTNGTVTSPGPGKLEFEFVVTDANGATTENRLHITQTGPDEYDSTLESEQGGTWKTVHTLHFKREK